MSQACFSLSVLSFLPVDSFRSSRAAAVAILPSALLVERFSLDAWWAFPIQQVLHSSWMLRKGQFGSWRPVRAVASKSFSLLLAA
jgi:hypothetical protein